MIFYRGDLDGTLVDNRLVKAAEHLSTEYQEINQFVDIRRSGVSFEILVQWEGLSEDSDRTWEPLAQLHEDVPDMLYDYLQTESKRGMKRKAQQMVFK